MEQKRTDMRLFYFSEEEITKAAKKVKQGKKIKGKPQRDLRVYSIEELEDKNALGKFFDDDVEEANIASLISDLKKGSYRVQPYTAIAIPQKDKDPRPILSPQPRERIVFTATLNRIRPKFDFMQRDYNIFGSARHERLKTIRKILVEIERLKKSHRYILKVDIKKFFPSVKKEELLADLRPFIKDDFIFQLIKDSIYNNLRYVGEAQKCKEAFVNPKTNIGIPQGCAYSPLFANFYARSLDVWLKDRGYNSFRYLDDLLIFTKDAKEAERVFNNLKRIGEGLNLKFHPLKEGSDKSYICSSQQTFEYLGMDVTKTGLRIPGKKVTKFLTTFKERFFNAETLRRCGKNKVFIFTERYIKGWQIYYSNTCPEHFPEVREQINTQLTAYMQKKQYRDMIEGMDIRTLLL